MLDPHLLRNNPEEVASALALRGFKFDCQAYQQLETIRKQLQVETQELQNERNLRSKEIGQAKARGQDIAPMRDAVTKISQSMHEKKEALVNVLKKLEDISLSIPNIPAKDVPQGADENFNKEIKRVGEIPSFDFVVKAHDDLGEDLKQMSFELASKITGSRFVILQANIARLHRALIQFMLNTHIDEHGYQELNVPCIVNAESLTGTGQLPKFEEDLFKLAGDSNYYLTSTAEIPVTNIVRDTIVPQDNLPLRFVCHSPCFRSEAGSYGKDTKGMIRQHQFEKVELVWITKPEDSYAALEILTSHAESILQKLNLAYRVVSLCTGDLGAGAAKTYDLEVWLPSQNTYREISSCSNTESYQARRMQARYRNAEGKTELVHTLNGSGLAAGRTLVAIMENYQNKDGSITIPDVLRPYMNGMDRIA